MAWHCVLAATVAVALYISTVGHDFVYDDNRAILSNDDVVGGTPLWSLLTHDFWGTPLRHGGSHGSYRPLTVLSFRLTAVAAAGGGAGVGPPPPAPFHAGNVALHAAAAAGVAAASRRLSGPRAAVVAGLLFAAHPAPSEAVAGVVGRADLAAAALTLAALAAYAAHADATARPAPGRRRRHLALAVALAVLATLAKEPGAMALPLCAAYDLLFAPLPPLRLLRAVLAVRRPAPTAPATPDKEAEEAVCARVRSSVRVLAAAFALAALTRALLSGGRLPEFATADNPAAKSESLVTRTLTFLYLPAFNFALLLYPRTLSFDWSMDAVPLVESLRDPRAAAALAFYCALAAVAVRHLNVLDRARPLPPAPSVDVNSNHECHGSPRRQRANLVVHVLGGCCPFSKRRASVSSRCKDEVDAGKNGVLRRDPRYDTSRVVLFSLAMMVLPFLPATNLVAYVGFVVAERLLYMPAMGFCLLVGHGAAAGWARARRRWGRRGARAAAAVAAVVLAALAARTAQRTADWRDEESLYRSGVAVNPPKAYGNLGNVLSVKGRLEEAERCYRLALRHRPNMADVHYNLGILLQNTQRWEEAIASYEAAIRYRPQLAAAHLNLGLALWRLGREAAADAALAACGLLDGTRTKDPRAHELARAACRFQRGRLAMERGRPREALDRFRVVLDAMPPHYQPQSLFNLVGEAHARLGDWSEAERWFRAALSAKPDHVPAHLTYGRLLSRNASRLPEAEKWYRRAEALAPHDPAVFRHYGQFLLSQRRAAEAAPKLLRALELSGGGGGEAGAGAGAGATEAPLYEDAVNAATALRLAGDLAGAERHYRLAVEIRPQEASGLANLGALYHLRGQLAEAERCYEQALQLQPDDAVTAANLRRLRRLQASATNGPAPAPPTAAATPQ